MKNQSLVCALQLHMMFLLQDFCYCINILCFICFKETTKVQLLCVTVHKYMLKFYTISVIKMDKRLVDQVMFLKSMH